MTDVRTIAGGQEKEAQLPDILTQVLGPISPYAGSRKWMKVAAAMTPASKYQAKRYT